MRNGISRRGLLAALPAAVLGGWLGRWLRPLDRSAVGAAAPAGPTFAEPAVCDARALTMTFVYDYVAPSGAIRDAGGLRTTVTYYLGSDRGPSDLAHGPVPRTDRSPDSPEAGPLAASNPVVPGA